MRLATTYLGMFRAAKDDFIDQVYQQVKDKVTPEEWQQTYDTIEKDANLRGHWEAGPEAFANAIEPLLLKLPVSKLLPKNAIAKIAGNILGKIGMVAGTEIPTEVITAKKQSEIGAKYGLEKEQTWGEAAKETAGPAAVGALLATGGFSVANKMASVYDHYRKKGAVAPDAPNELASKETPQQQYQDAINRSTSLPQTTPFNVPMMGLRPDILSQQRAMARPEVPPFNVPMMGVEDVSMQQRQREAAIAEGSEKRRMIEGNLAVTEEGLNTTERDIENYNSQIETELQKKHRNILYIKQLENKVDIATKRHRSLFEQVKKLRADLSAAAPQNISDIGNAATQAQQRAVARPQVQPFSTPMQQVPDRPAMARQDNQQVLNALGQMEALGELQPEQPQPQPIIMPAWEKPVEPEPEVDYSQMQPTGAWEMGGLSRDQVGTK